MTNNVEEVEIAPISDRGLVEKEEGIPINVATVEVDTSHLEEK